MIRLSVRGTACPRSFVSNQSSVNDVRFADWNAISQLT